MKARVEWRMGTDQMEVWFYDRMADGRARIPQITGQWTDRIIESGEVMPDSPSLLLPTEWMKALVEAGGDALPPSGQMAEHLKDATRVRDRLLSMVEHKWGIR